MLKNCRICGKVFEANNPRYCTCSSACSLKNAKALNKKWRQNNVDRMREYNAKRTRKYKKPIILCGICGEEVPQICSERGYSRKRYHEECVVNEMHPHSFRHFFAMEFLKRNGNIALLADLLGHGSVNVTQLYLRQSQEQQRQAIDKAVDW